MMEQFSTLLNSDNLIVDGIILAIFLIFAIIGFKRGFYKSVAPIVITVVSITASIFGTNLLEAKAYDIVYPVFSTELTKRIDAVLNHAADSGKIIKALVERINIDAEADKLAEIITKDLVHVILLIVLFFVGLIVFNLIGKIFERIVSISLVTTFDGILGAAYWILICFVLLFLAVKGTGLANIDFFTKYQDESMILDWIIKL